MNKFIHQTSCTYLAVIILIRMMAMPIAFFDFKVNQSYIAGNLCENRLNSELHCSGKCFLSKQLAKSNDNPGSTDQKGTAKNLIIDFFLQIEKRSFACLGTTSANNTTFLRERLVGTYPDNIFHPPIYILNA